MSKPTHAWPSSSKPIVAWGSRASATVIEVPARHEVEWQFHSQQLPAEGASIDDVIAELGLEAEIAGISREMGNALAEAGEMSLRALRLKAGLSQRELGERIAMSQANVARMEKRPGNLGIETLRRLAKALGVDLNSLDKAIP